MTSSLNTRGVALPLVLIVLGVLGTLVAAGFLLARLELSNSHQGLTGLQSRAAAEGGIEEMLTMWDGASWDTLPPGVSLRVGAARIGGAVHEDSLTRLGGDLFLLRSVGEVLDGGGQALARTDLGRWVRLARLAFPLGAAIVGSGPIEFTGNAIVDGSDLIPTNWGARCPPPSPAEPAVRDSSGQMVFGGACSGGQCLTGSPPWLADTTLTDSVLSHYGEWTFASLAALAGPTLSGTLSGVGPVVDSTTGQCDAGSPTNWGEPIDSASPCFDYAPVTRLGPGTRVDGGRGQGILLGEGDLELGGGFDFYGVVIVQGTLVTTGSGAGITGGLVLRSAPDTSKIGGSTRVLRSTCWVHRVVTLGVPAVPIRVRSWAHF